MKKLISFSAISIIIVALVFIYLKIGNKAATETKIYMENSQSLIDSARQSMNEQKIAAEEAEKAIELIEK